MILSNWSEQGFSNHFWKLQNCTFWIYLTQLNKLISWLIDLLYDLSWVSPVRETMCSVGKAWGMIWKTLHQSAHLIFVQTTDANCHKLQHITWLKPHTDSYHQIVWFREWILWNLPKTGYKWVKFIFHPILKRKYKKSFSE